MENENVAGIGGGNSALQTLENLHALTRKVHLISTPEITADAMVMERAACIANLQTYIGYKVIQFIGDEALTGVINRKMAGADTLDLPPKGAFIAVGPEPNPSLVAPLLNLNARKEIMISPDCSLSYPGIFAAGDVTGAFGKGILIVSGEGARAAPAARQYLLNLRKTVCPPS